MVRLVLNNAVQVGEGCIAYASNKNVTTEDLERVQYSATLEWSNKCPKI